MLVMMGGGACFLTNVLTALAAVEMDCYSSLISTLSSCLNIVLDILLLV